MNRAALIALLASAGVACNGAAQVGSGATDKSKQPADRVGGERPVTQPGAFHVTAAGDLGAPLQQAFEKARNEGLSTFTVTLAPGTYRGSIDLTDPRDAGGLSIVLAGEGPGPAVIAGGTIKLAAASVTLRNVVVDGAQAPASPLRIRVETAATLEGVAVVGSAVADGQMVDPIAEVRAVRGKPSARVADSWFVRNRSASGKGATLDFAADPGKAFSSIELDNVVFAGNETAYSLRPRYAGAARLRGVVFHEPNVSQAAIYLNSPQVKLSIEGGVIASARKALEYMVNIDAKRSDYTTATMNGTSVRLAAPIPADDIAQTGVRAGDAAPAPAWDAVMAAARGGEKPSAAKLGL